MDKQRCMPATEYGSSKETVEVAVFFSRSRANHRSGRFPAVHIPNNPLLRLVKEDRSAAGRALENSPLLPLLSILITKREQPGGAWRGL